MSWREDKNVPSIPAFQKRIELFKWKFSSFYRRKNDLFQKSPFLSQHLLPSALLSISHSIEFRNYSFLACCLEIWARVKVLSFRARSSKLEDFYCTVFCRHHLCLSFPSTHPIIHLSFTLSLFLFPMSDIIFLRHSRQQSYMEDHLRNRDRLNKEWEGLCSYEADQHSTTIANLPANRKKNRYIDILPYDHSRVILGAGTPSNSKSSTSSSVDYINASAIVSITHLVRKRKEVGHVILLSR